MFSHGSRAIVVLPGPSGTFNATNGLKEIREVQSWSSLVVELSVVDVVLNRSTLYKQQLVFFEDDGHQCEWFPIKTALAVVL